MKQKLNCIMLIDDDEPTNFLSTMLIEEAECTKHLRIVDSGTKAISYLQSTAACRDEKNYFLPPDLIFLDINMPRMNGWEFLDEYKKLENVNPVKTVIIMLTTSLNPDDKQRAESIPEVSGFEIKPLTNKMICDVLKKYFNAGQKQVRNETSVLEMNVVKYIFPPKLNYK